MGALPRPATPGPWTYDKSIGTVVIPGGEPSDADMETVAATWDRVDREDRVRAFCEHLITGAADHPDDNILYVEGAVARQVLRILDGEEGA